MREYMLSATNWIYTLVLGFRYFDVRNPFEKEITIFNHQFKIQMAIGLAAPSEAHFY